MGQYLLQPVLKNRLLNDLLVGLHEVDYTFFNGMTKADELRRGPRGMTYG